MSALYVIRNLLPVVIVMIITIDILMRETISVRYVAKLSIENVI